MNRKEIEKFVIGTSRVLIDAFEGEGCLVIPNYGDKEKIEGNIEEGNIRLSEQELRLAAIHYLQSKCIKHSIETPTQNEYSFSGGKGSVSAQTDLSIHFGDTIRDGKSISLRVEFKAHQPDLNALQKDILKLRAEKEKGIFFHVFQNTDVNTVESLIKKFQKEIPQNLKVKNNPALHETYYIAILCLNYKGGKLNEPNLYFFESDNIVNYENSKINI